MNFKEIFGENVNLIKDDHKSDKKNKAQLSLQIYFLKHILRVKAWIFLIKLQYQFLPN